MRTVRTPLGGWHVMSDTEFDARLKKIEERYAADRSGADAGRDQELSRLFMEAKESGRDQKWIAAKMGQAESWVSQRLCFGRFLRFTTGESQALRPKNLTERRFRTHWRAAGKHTKEAEADRFARVLERLKIEEGDLPGKFGNLVRKPGIKKAVIDVLSDGQRRTTPEIAAIVSETIPETDANQVIKAIHSIQKQPPPGMALDARHAGRSHKYRLVSRRRSPAPVAEVDPDRLGAVAAEALPLIAESIEILKAPVVGRQTTLALEHLWRVERMLKSLLVPEGVA